VGLIRRKGTDRSGEKFSYLKRVPKRYAGLVKSENGKPLKEVRIALRTDSRTEAEAKAAQIERALFAEWEALLAGDEGTARAHYLAARSLAEARGFPYVPMNDLAAGNLDELVRRVLTLGERDGSGVASAPAAEAILGAVPEALPSFKEAVDEYFAEVRARHTQKSEGQRKKWRNTRDRAVARFLEVMGREDMPLAEVDRAAARKFRDWWLDRIAEGYKINSANMEIGALSDIVSTWAKAKDVELDNPFAGLSVPGKDKSERPPFSRAFIRDTMLKPGALDAMNDEARDVLLMLVNTGCRPSEITDAPLEDFVVDAPIPFLRIAPNGRELKVAHTRRDIPLLGVSLDAARRIVARGGISDRYAHKAAGWSAAVNKFLRTNGLLETPKHVVYSIRHYVEDAMLEAGVDDRVRADILGHKYDRPRYGAGGALAGRRKALEAIALEAGVQQEGAKA
jgi:integrase